jgi:hypothetical protein
LEIAHIVKTRGAAMKKIVNEPYSVFTMFRHKCVNGLVFAEEALPGCLGDLFGKRSRAAATVKVL